MIHSMFTVHDSATLAYLPPFPFATVGQAKRTFMNMCQNSEHNYYRNPSDYTLFHIGYFDDQNAHLEVFSTPLAIAKALDYKEFQGASVNGDMPIASNGDDQAVRDGF